LARSLCFLISLCLFAAARAQSRISSGHNEHLMQWERIRRAFPEKTSLQLLHLVFLQGPLQTGAPGVTSLHAAGDVGVANSSDDVLGVDRAQLTM
jgi:hypothetical protein